MNLFRALHGKLISKPLLTGTVKLPFAFSNPCLDFASGNSRFGLA